MEFIPIRSHSVNKKPYNAQEQLQRDSCTIFSDAHLGSIKRNDGTYNEYSAEC